MTTLTPADKLVLLSELEKRVKAAKDAAKAEWAAGARPKQRDAAALGDDELGTVTMTKGRESWRLTDEKALIAWARDNAPHLIVERIAEADLTALKRKPITEEGEILPGFEPVTGEPYPSIRAVPGAAALIESAVAAGALAWADVLELEQ